MMVLISGGSSRTHTWNANFVNRFLQFIRPVGFDSPVDTPDLQHFRPLSPSMAMRRFLEEATIV
jgi:hypothetical protein